MGVLYGYNNLLIVYTVQYTITILFTTETKYVLKYQDKKLESLKVVNETETGF